MDTNKTGFRAELETLINRHSKENGSDTPDFILADYMADCLDAYDKAVTRRTEWYVQPLALDCRVRGDFKEKKVDVKDLKMAVAAKRPR